MCLIFLYATICSIEKKCTAKVDARGHLLASTAAVLPNSPIKSGAVIFRLENQQFLFSYDHLFFL